MVIALVSVGALVVGFVAALVLVPEDSCTQCPSCGAPLRLEDRHAWYRKSVPVNVAVELAKTRAKYTAA
jgi:hypothetical protein